MQDLTETTNRKQNVNCTYQKKKKRLEMSQHNIQFKQMKNNNDIIQKSKRKGKVREYKNRNFENRK